MTQQLKELTVLGNSGELPSGMAWMEENGEKIRKAMNEADRTE